MLADAANSSALQRMYVKGMPFKEVISTEASPRLNCKPHSSLAALGSSSGFSPKTSAIGFWTKIVHMVKIQDTVAIFMRTNC